MLFDCWRSGDLYTFYEATWYDWISAGDNTRESYRTIDSKTGKEMSLEDLIDNEQRVAFAKIMMKNLISQAGERASYLRQFPADGLEVLSRMDGCGLIREGLIVYFYPYTLAPGAVGQINAVIPFSELTHCLKIRNMPLKNGNTIVSS